MRNQSLSRLEEWLESIQKLAEGTASPAAQGRTREVLSLLARRFPSLPQPVVFEDEDASLEIVFQPAGNKLRMTIGVDADGRVTNVRYVNLPKDIGVTTVPEIEWSSPVLQTAGLLATEAYLIRVFGGELGSDGVRQALRLEAIASQVEAALRVAVSSMVEFWDPAIFFDDVDQAIELVWQSENGRVELALARAGGFDLYRGDRHAKRSEQLTFALFPGQHLAGALAWVSAT